VGMGHRLVVGGPWSGACTVQFIQADPDSGAYIAGSDPRADGAAVAY